MRVAWIIILVLLWLLRYHMRRSQRARRAFVLCYVAVVEFVDGYRDWEVVVREQVAIDPDFADLHMYIQVVVRGAGHV